MFFIVLLAILIQGSHAVLGGLSGSPKIYYVLSNRTQGSGSFVPRDTGSLYFDSCATYSAGSAHRTELSARYFPGQDWWPVTGTTCGGGAYVNDGNIAHYTQMPLESATTSSSFLGVQFTVQNMDATFSCADSRLTEYMSGAGKPFGFTVGWTKNLLASRNTGTDECPATADTGRDFINADQYGAGLPADTDGLAFTFDYVRACNTSSLATDNTWFNALEAQSGATGGNSPFMLPSSMTQISPALNKGTITTQIFGTTETTIRIEMVVDSDDGNNDELRISVNGNLALYSNAAHVSNSFAGLGQFFMSGAGCGPEIRISKVTVFRDAHTCMKNTCGARLGEPNYGLATCQEENTTAVHCSCIPGYAYANWNGGGTLGTNQSISALVGGANTNENVWSTCQPIVTCAVYRTNPAPNATCSEGGVNVRVESCSPGYSYNGSYAGINQTLTGSAVAISCTAVDMCSLYPAPINGTCNTTAPNERTITCNNGYSVNNSHLGVSVRLIGLVDNPSCNLFNLCTVSDYTTSLTHASCVWGGPGVDYMKRTITCDPGWTNTANDFSSGATTTPLTDYSFYDGTTHCTNNYDMCAAYSSSVVNGNCTSSGPGNRVITCLDGYSTNTSSNGTQITYTGTAPHLPCSVPLQMCDVYSPSSALVSTHQNCTNNGLNSRNLTCFEGYGRSNTSGSPGITLVLTGPNGIPVNCSVLDMCAVYSPPGSVANGTCAFTQLFNRTITCDAGYSTDANNNTNGVVVTYTGTGPVANCSFILSMCSIYSPVGIPHGTCYDGYGANIRNFTCDAGYSTNGLVSGISKLVTGTDPAPTCSPIDTCGQFSPSPPNATCTAGLGWRAITCNLGYSSNNSILGIFQNITTGNPPGSDPGNNCTVILDMCGNYSATRRNETCANGAPGYRIITCTDGYSTNGSITGITNTYYNVSAHTPCLSILDMCLYSPNGSIAHATCTFNASVPNQRIITCDTGYSVTNTPGNLQIVRYIDGNGAAGTITPCAQTDMCLVYSPSGSVDHGSCANGDVNVRNITCSPGYSSNTDADLTGVTRNYTGSAPHVNCSNLLPMCLIYSPNASIGNGSCVLVAANVRNITCNDGYSSNGGISGIVQTLTGSAPYTNCTELGMCGAYSPVVRNGTCVSGTNMRTITCNPGYSSNTSILGRVAVYIGMEPHIDCTFILPMCASYSPVLRNETCQNGAPGDRTILCNPGYSTNTSKTGVNVTYNNTIDPHTPCLTILDMCEAYSPNSSLINATCYFDPAVPNTRLIACATGYSASNTTGDLQINRTIVGSDGFSQCWPTDMCAVYSPAVLNGACAVVAPNIRQITCSPGYSANAAADITGTVINYTGTVDHVNCTFILPMCEIYSPTASITNGACANTGVFSRNITCNDGYSSNGAPSGIIQIISGTGGYQPCTVLGMCATYSPPASIQNGTCVSGTNTRTITCNPGYSTNTSTAGRVVVYIGTGAHDNCTYILDMCASYSPVRRNESCINGAPGDRTILCDPGYSTNTSKTGVNVTYNNTIAPHDPCLTILDMCIAYSPNSSLFNATCYFNPAYPNNRTITCLPGYSTTNSSADPQVTRHINGSGGFTDCGLTDMCAVYSPVLGNETCNWTVNTRIITCTPGYSHNALVDLSGVNETIVGTAPHQTCDKILDVCAIYSPPASLINGTCISPAPNVRNITCNDGYSINASVPGMYQLLTGNTPHKNCTDIGMCMTYSPAGSIANGTCAAGRNYRVITCNNGYSINSSVSGRVTTYYGNEPHVNCTVILDMCGNYSQPLRNETCYSPGPGDRIINCTNGYSSTALLSGINVSYINNIDYHAPCLTIVDMCLWSPNSSMIGSTCTFDPATPNRRRIECDPGYTVSNSTTTPQLVQYVDGSGPYAICYVADMCVLYSPVGSIANGTCNFSTPNQRNVTCDAGYSSNGNNNTGGLSQILTGNQSHLNCSFIVHMCGTYSATITNGTCYDTGINERTITCNPGYSSDNTIAGITQVIHGAVGYLPCTVLDMCASYSPPASIINGTCAFNYSRSNRRVITCQAGGSSNGTQSIAGITQVLHGTEAHANCTFELDMCLYSPTPINATCTHGYNTRYIHCNDGYSTNNSVLGIDQIIMGTAAVLPCSVLNMCTAYFVSPQSDNAYCNFTVINERSITCINGYGVNTSFPDGLGDHVVGNGPTKLCNVAFPMCLFPPGQPANGNCTSPAVNTRHIMCNSGYSTNGTVAGTETYLIGTANNYVNCSVMNMCLYRTVGNATCNTTAINQRTYYCNPGYFFGGSGSDTVQVVNGIDDSSVYECNITLPMCSVYSPPAKLINANCTSAGPNDRTITCTDGWSTNNFTNGTVQHITGLSDHQNCTTILNMCIYSPSNASNNLNAACVFNQSRVNYRTINCNPGYGFDNVSLTPTLTKEFWGVTNFTPMCTNLDMCAAYSPTAGNSALSNTTCYWNYTMVNYRIISCVNGYSQDLTTNNLTWIATGAAPHTDCPQVIGMCAYDPNPANATCLNTGVNQRTIICRDGYSGNGTIAGINRTFFNASYPPLWTNCTRMSMCLFSPNSSLINGTCFDTAINNRFILCNNGTSINATIEGITQNLTGPVPYQNCTTEVPMCLYQTWFRNGTCYNTSFYRRDIVCDPGYSSNNTHLGINQTVIGPGLPLNCTKLDMCVYKPNGSFANGYCLSPNINEAIIFCNPGYGWENSTAGPNKTYVGMTAIGAALPCLPMDMCSVYSPTVLNGTCNNTGINQRNITCDPGYSSNASVPGIIQIINGTAAHRNCLDILLMCRNYTYNSNIIPNGTCIDIALNTREIICNNGYAWMNYTAPTGTELNITGPGGLPTRFGGCLFQDMCVYSDPLRGGDGLLNGTCSSGLYNRTITCTPGFSANASTAGTVQRLPGIAPHINCSFVLDMCLYTPSYQRTPGGTYPANQMTCASLTLNTRIIRCNDGFSINNTIPGIWQTIIGPSTPQNCTFLNMCTAWSPVINSTSMQPCVFSSSTPNQRSITCQPGYSTNGTIAGITQVLYGNVSHTECTPFDMCQYNVPRTFTNSCVTTGVNTRLVTCVLGYSINGTFAGASQVIVGTAANVDCYDIDECALLGCGASNVSNATCVNGINQRTCQCNLGYAYDGYARSSTVTFIGNNNTYAAGCQDIPECIRYGCQDASSSCIEPLPNMRTCICQPGYTVTNGIKELRYVNITGNDTDTRPCQYQINMCFFGASASINGCGANATCSFTTPNTRTCTCIAGTSRVNPNITGGYDRYTLIGDSNDQPDYGGCTEDIDECSLYSCYNDLVNTVNATCESSSTLDTRICRCPAGWQPLNGTQVPSKPLINNRAFDGCTNISMCARFGCYGSITTDFNLWNDTVTCENFQYDSNGNVIETLNVRTCTCRPGYRNDLSGTAITGPVAFGTCVAINECNVYSCGNATACEDRINARRCYCPFGTKNVTSYDSEVLVGNATATLICSDDDECEMFGCFDNRTKQDRTCRNEIGYRVCECPEGLIGTLTLGGADYASPFPGCFAQVAVSDVHSLGYTLQDGTYTDWRFAYEIDLTGDGELDMIVVRGTPTQIGWFEKPALSTATKLIDHFDTAVTATCDSPSVFTFNGKVILSCHTAGDITRYTFNKDISAFEADPAVVRKRAVVTNLGGSGYSGTSATCSAVHPVTGHNLELFGKGHMVFDFDTDTLYDQNAVQFSGFHPVEADSTDTVADCAFLDINGDTFLDIFLATTSDNATHQGFFWFLGTSATSFSFVPQGSFFPDDTPAKVVVASLNNNPAVFDMIAVTTNCYSMYMAMDIMSYGLNANLTVVPGQDGACETCGCGSPGQILPHDWNNDGYVDLIAVVSGGAQLFMNQGGTFYFQTLLGGCAHFQLYNMDSDPTPDLICSDSGVAVWYSMGQPNSCAEGTHSCTQVCTDSNWAGFECSCWDDEKLEKRYVIDLARLANESRVYCIDYDECNNTRPDGSPYCLYGCTNTEGWYNCSCANSYGYRILDGGDCQNIDECTDPTFTTYCRDGVTSCQDTEGGYLCPCTDGYEPDYLTPNPNTNYNNTINCVDIDECAVNRATRANETLHNITGDDMTPLLCEQNCNNTEGSYVCTCDLGYSGSRFCTQIICELDAWTQWSPTCDCGVIQKRRRNEKYVAGVCGGEEKEETVTSMCNYTDYCSPLDGPPSGLAAADEIIEKFMSDDLIANFWPGWKRRVNTKRAHAPGVYVFDADSCTAEGAWNVSQAMVSNIGSILTLPSSRVLVTTYPDTNVAPLPRDDTSNCTITLDFSGAYPFDYIPIIIALVVGIPLLLALFAYTYWWFAKKALDAKLEVLMNLPPAITKHYRDCIINPDNGWERLDNEPVLFRKLLTAKKDVEWVEHIFHLLDGGGIKYNQIYAVFNPSLVNQMGLTWEKFENRVATNPQMFYAEKWQHEEKCTQSLLKQRQWIKSVFVNRVASFAWNQALSVPIIPTIHGTSASVAWKVCQSGFATLSALDIGFFGAGIYFTTSAKYAVPYFATKPNPAIIISYLVPGNPYPVTEDPNGPHSLAGQAVKPGYQCNYVLTTNRGMPFPQIEKKHIFDEIVIRQETQVAPAYVLMLDPRSFPALIRSFERMTAEDDPANFAQDD